MSKLYKELNYDTDRVMQPGDPITSPNGNTSVSANNNGTATLSSPYVKEVVASASGSSEDSGGLVISYHMSFTSENTIAELTSGVEPTTISGTLTITPPSPAPSTTYTATWTKIPEEGAPVYTNSDNGYSIYFDQSYCQIYSNSFGMDCQYTTQQRTGTTTKQIEVTDHTHTPASIGAAAASHGHSASDIKSGTLPVSRGGTGKISHTVNSVIIGGASATGALQNVTSAKGAFYSTGSNKKPTFGTLPVAQGGTGMTTTTNVNAVVIGNSSDAANAMQTVATANGAFYATGANSKPKFGTLPVAQGGTGVNGSSQAINKVLASPASGSAGSISFRSLVEADIPTLSTSKISGLGDAATKNVGTASGTVAAGDHTHSDYVSKSETSNQTVSSEITMPILTVGNRNLTGTVGAKSVSEGYTNTASGECSHAEGHNSVASEYCAHAEGQTSTASGYVSHAEGQSCTASGYTSHAEGYCNNATGSCSHAEGAGTYAVGNDSHAEGNGGNNSSLGARGEGSHVEGYATVAQNNYEHAQGRYNASHKASDAFGNAGNTLSSIGFSTDSNPKNAVEVMQDGKVFIYGMGGYNGTNPTGTGVKDLATIASGDHTHSSLKNGNYTASLPTLTANKTIATTDEANLTKLLNLYVDETTPTTAFEMDSSVGWYRGCIGSDGVLPTLDWSNFSIPTDSVYQCTLALKVNSSATTLTGPSDISWVSGAGLPTSSFAGHWIFISLIREGWENSFTQAAVWRVL